MHLSHPETPMEKLSSMKPIPGAKEVGDCCSRRLCTWAGLRACPGKT